jgi:hypothetical protein
MKGIKLVNHVTGHAWTMPLGGAERVRLVYDTLVVNEDAIAVFTNYRWSRLNDSGFLDKNNGVNEYTDVEFIS